MNSESKTLHTHVSTIRFLPGILGKGEISIKLNEADTRILFRDLSPEEVARLSSKISTCIDEALQRED